MARRHRQYLKLKEQWRPPVGREKLPPDEVIRAEYASSHPLTALATRWGVSLDTLRREIAALGLPPRRQVRGPDERPSRAVEPARQLSLSLEF